MKIYVTRHGQVELNAQYFNGDVSLPKGEVPLSELGRQQAVLLGKRMRELGFRGKIFSSPFFRTMETAELIARETKAVIVPTPWIHEKFVSQPDLELYRGFNTEELRCLFSHIAKDVDMEEIWWPSRVEDVNSVRERVTLGLGKCLSESEGDILLVGHGASVGAVYSYLHLRKNSIIWNCSLGLYDTEHPENNYGNNIEHLPRHMVSNNKLMGMDIDFDDTWIKPNY